MSDPHYKTCNILVEACLKMLSEELARNEAMLPHRDHTAVVDSIAQLCQGHVKFVHSVNKTRITQLRRHIHVHYHSSVNDVRSVSIIVLCV